MHSTCTFAGDLFNTVVNDFSFTTTYIFMKTCSYYELRKVAEMPRNSLTIVFNSPHIAVIVVDQDPVRNRFCCAVLIRNLISVFSDPDPVLMK